MDSPARRGSRPAHARARSAAAARDHARSRRPRARRGAAAATVSRICSRCSTDDEARIRRRAALAVGRTRLAEGVAPLAARARHAMRDPEVRQMAAFALGLIGDAGAADALTTALADPDPLVQGRAAEGAWPASRTSRRPPPSPR